MSRLRATRRRALEEPGKPDLTPAIDLVFNLIVFFLVVSELGQQDLLDLQLAHASQAQPPRAVDPSNALRLDLSGDGEISLRGRRYPARLGQSQALAGALRQASARGDAPEGALVTIRAARGAPFGQVQAALEACVGAELWRTQLAASPDAPR